MRAVILDGSPSDDPTAPAVTAALLANCPEARPIVLRDERIGNCAGDFLCWTRTPGVCNVNDANRTITAQAYSSDLLILLTPITFGGYSAQLKRAVDHLIPALSPLFTTIDGETHHRRRHSAYPDLLVIGWHPQAGDGERDDQADQATQAAESTFRHLVHRHGLNTHARTVVCATLTSHPSAAELETQARDWLAAIKQGKSSPTPPTPALTAPGPAATGCRPPKRAVLLVGSPRTGTSSSQALGDHILGRLAERGVETEILQVYTGLSSAAKRERNLPTLDAADLVLLSFPLYVDSLPAPVIALLERLAPRERRVPAPALAAIANCGFPEAEHNITSLAICARFAEQAGFTWAGGLAVGGGEGLVHGRPPRELGGRASRLRKGLDLAAEALATGAPIPQEAWDLVARPAIPAWLYRWVGNIGWYRQARRNQVASQLNSPPASANPAPGR